MLRPALPGGVVTWFVTGFAIAFSNWHLTETSRIGDEQKTGIVAVVAALSEVGEKHVDG